MNVTNVTSSETGKQLPESYKPLNAYIIVTIVLGLACLVLLVIHYGLKRYYTRKNRSHRKRSREKRHYQMYRSDSSDEESPNKKLIYPSIFLQRIMEKRQTTN